jgi:hypothetical protein
MVTFWPSVNHQLQQRSFSLWAKTFGYVCCLDLQIDTCKLYLIRSKNGYVQNDKNTCSCLCKFFFQFIYSYFPIIDIIFKERSNTYAIVPSLKYFWCNYLRILITIPYRSECNTYHTCIYLNCQNVEMQFGSETGDSEARLILKFELYP